MKQLTKEEFKRIIGVVEEAFEKMLEILEISYAEQHKAGGKPPRITVKGRLEITLQYYREYRTMEHIGNSYGITKGRVCTIIRWVEKELLKDKAFHLPGKKALLESGSAIECAVVDVTESPVQRPKKNKRSGIRAKKSAIR